MQKLAEKYSAYFVVFWRFEGEKRLNGKWCYVRSSNKPEGTRKDEDT
jgi:hypothetical protein